MLGYFGILAPILEYCHNHISEPVALGVHRIVVITLFVNKFDNVKEVP